jgi:hypothetical protein
LRPALRTLHATVDGKGDIRVAGGAGRPAGGRLGPAIAVAVVAGAALLALGSFRGSGTVVPDETIPEVVPDQIEAAFVAVDEFAAAWNRGDAAAAASLVAGEWDSVLLPGFADSQFTPRDGRAALESGIAFLSSVTRLSLGPCDAVAPSPDSRATTDLRCDDGGLEGDYLDAVARNIWEDIRPMPDRGEPGLTFGIRGDRIISIEAGGPGFAPQAYCIWAEQNRPADAGSLFDLWCRPDTTAAAAAIHAQLAAEFVAEGAPLPSRRLTDARLAAAYVDRFAEHHNLGDVFTARGWLSQDVDASDLPGFPDGDAEPTVDEFLAWSARLLEIDVGACEVAYSPESTVVTCSEMTVGGPLLDDPVAQPTRFTLSPGSRRPVARAPERILAVEPLGGDPVPVEQICRLLEETDREAAAAVFTADCTPVYPAAASSAAALGGT